MSSKCFTLLFQNSRQAITKVDLEEIPTTLDHFPAVSHITKFVKNKLYRIPDAILPETKLYEIEVLLWSNLFVFLFVHYLTSIDSVLGLA